MGYSSWDIFIILVKWHQSCVTDLTLNNCDTCSCLINQVWQEYLLWMEPTVASSACYLILTSLLALNLRLCNLCEKFHGPGDDVFMKSPFYTTMMNDWSINQCAPMDIEEDKVTFLSGVQYLQTTAIIFVYRPSQS